MTDSLNPRVTAIDDGFPKPLVGGSTPPGASSLANSSNSNAVDSSTNDFSISDVLECLSPRLQPAILEPQAAAIAIGGISRSPTYRSWESAKRRCLSPSWHNWARYGGRGVTICQRWSDSFAAFLADMGERPSGTTLDRFPDRDGNYEPGNCRWATRQQQDRNRSDNRFVTHNGETLCVADWAQRTGIPYSTIKLRLSKGWSIERTLGTPPDPAMSALARRKAIPASGHTASSKVLQFPSLDPIPVFVALDFLTGAEKHLRDQFDPYNCSSNFAARLILLDAMSALLDEVKS